MRIILKDGGVLKNAIIIMEEGESVESIVGGKTVINDCELYNHPDAPKDNLATYKLFPYQKDRSYMVQG